jgi:hypothetical protein
MKDMTQPAVLNVKKNKDNNPILRDVLIQPIVDLIVSDPEIAYTAVKRIVETEINRKPEGSDELSWRKLTGENPMDGTEWLLARLRGASGGTGRFKGNDDDRKKGAELLSQLTKAGRLESWEKENGLKPTLENLSRIFTNIREKAAQKADEDAAAAMKAMTR